MRHSAMMSYKEAGEGFAVLLGHSYLFNNTMWAEQIDILSKKYRVIAPDLWGHGNSPELPSYVRDLKHIAQDNLNLLDSLGIEKFAVVGLSVGGMWAAELAKMAQERVSGIMFFDTYVGSESREMQTKYFYMLDDIAHHGALRPPLIEQILPLFYSKYASEEEVQMLAKHLSSLTAQNLRQSIVPLGRMIFGRPDRRDILTGMTCPTQVATGSLDLPRPPAEGKEMAELLRCKFTLIENAGHISNREQPQFVNEIILDFMDTLDIPGS